MEKVTLRVNIKEDQYGCDFVTATNGKRLAGIYEQIPGRYCAYCNMNNHVDMKTYTEAIEYASDFIERFFGEYGIEVEFVNVED